MMSQESIKESINRLNGDLWEAERAGVEGAAKLSKAEFRSSSREDLKEFGEDEGWACSGLRQVSNRLKDYRDGLPRGRDQLGAPDTKTCLGKALVRTARRSRVSLYLTPITSSRKPITPSTALL